ncbi:MAG: type I methionyl aminopeptidase [Eubacteriales bacterium]|jgi:methionyl aminopeptidase
MITIKSPEAIEKMKVAGRITRGALAEVQKHIAPGVSTWQLDKVAYDYICSHGAKPSFKGYGGFPATICASVNDMVIHGIPNKHTILKEGDIISIDVGAYIGGYHGDAARTFPVGEIGDDVKQLIQVTRQSFFEGLQFAREGNRLSDISHAIGSYCESFGYGVVRDFTGHGIGRAMHEDPAVLNYGPPGKGVRLRAGMVLAIEPMVNLGTWQVKVLEDGWSTVTCDGKPAAHYENTVLITEDEPQLLTVL